jgi:general secretion pathway protein N
MKRYGLLIALGILALLGFVVATLPASVAGGQLARMGVQTAALSGSIWSGTATGVAWRGAPLGRLDWRITPTALLQGRVAGHARITRDDGSLDSDFSAGFSGKDLRFSTATIALPIAALTALPLGMPPGWQGTVSGQFEEIHVSAGWPVALRGSLDVDGLVAPPPRSALVGSYHAVFPHPRPQGSAATGAPLDPAALTARVIDKQGPFSVDAQLTLQRDRNFLLEGTLAPRGPVPPAMERSLQFLGPADASGRRPFSVGGTL